MKSSLKKLNLVVAIGAAILLSSCKTVTNTTVTSDVEGPTVIQKPVVADLDVKETKVSGTATAKRSVPVEEVKQMAVADALTTSNADVLVEPRYEITKDFRSTTVTVTGYPATYTNFRPMEIQDTMFIDRDRLGTTKARREIKGNTRLRKILVWTGAGVVSAAGIFFLTVLFL
mgnify:CR=1 FL=1